MSQGFTPCLTSRDRLHAPEGQRRGKWPGLHRPRIDSSGPKRARRLEIVLDAPTSLGGTGVDEICGWLDRRQSESLGELFQWRPESVGIVLNADELRGRLDRWNL